MSLTITARTKPAELTKNAPIRKALIAETAMETIAILLEMDPAGGMMGCLREAREDLELALFDALVAGNEPIAFFVRIMLGRANEALHMVIENDAETWGA